MIIATFRLAPVRPLANRETVVDHHTLLIQNCFDIKTRIYLTLDAV
jgi:hypothetical protein